MVDNNKITTERNSNIELYRIIVMLLIVAHHYVVNSGIMDVLQSSSFSFKSIFFYLFGAWGKTGINCFVMITGYFMCKSNITLRKFLKLLFQIEFYNIIISSVFWISGYNGMNFMSFLRCILPIQSISQGFTSCYILFWLTIPFLNKLIAVINKEMHQYLILLLLFVYTFMPFVPGAEVVMNYVSWFVVLYFIASYVRLYPESIYKNSSARFWGFVSLLLLLMSGISVVVVFYANTHFGIMLHPYCLVSDCNRIFAVALGFASFMYFNNLSINTSKFINRIAGCTFGVLLVHANSSYMRQWLWYDVCHNVDCYYDNNYVIHAFACVICVFSLCIMIDMARKYLEEIIFNNIQE